MRTWTLSSPTAGSVDFNTGVPDADGCLWVAQDLDGWDGPDIRLDTQPRLGTPGQFLQAGEPLARTLSIKDGLLLAPTEAARLAARDRLLAILLTVASPDAAGTVTVHDVTATPGVTLDRHASFYTSQRPTLVDVRPGEGGVGGVASGAGMKWPTRLGITVLAPDPLRYGADASAPLSGGMTVSVAGTAPTAPVVTLAGPGSPTFLTHTDQGRTVVLAGSMPATLVVDLASRTVVDGGGTNRFDLVTSDPTGWWDLLPGTNHISVTGSGGTLAWQPAWW